MMPIVALSSCEAELYAAALTAMDMMFVYHIMKSMGLKVELPMLLYMDNHGAIGLSNNWTTGGRMRHVNVRQTYLRELKEQGLIETRYRKGEKLQIDNGTKNNKRKLFISQTSKYMLYPLSNN